MEFCWNRKPFELCFTIFNKDAINGNVASLLDNYCQYNKIANVFTQLMSSRSLMRSSCLQAARTFILETC
jgi:hypothetical protein